MAASTLDRGGAWTAGGTRIRVEARRLCAWLEEPVDFLKMDIEGPEVEVLEECGDRLKNVRSLFCEYHQGGKLDSARLPRLLKTLADRGFEVQVGKSHSHQLSTERRPGTFLDGPYSGVVWAHNPKWKR